MRIYFYTFTVLGKGGLETVLEYVANELERRGHEVRVLVMDMAPHGDPSWLDRLPGAILCARNQYGMDEKVPGGVVFDAVLNLQNVLSRLPAPDVVVATHQWSCLIAKLATNTMPNKPPIVSWLHASLDVTPSNEVLEYADAHLAISTGIEQQLKKVTPAKPVAVVYNPYEQQDLPVVARPEVPTFVYVGRIDNYQKRIDVLMRAFGTVRHLNWRLRMIGDAVVSQNGDRSQMRDLARALDIDDRIEWLGWQEAPWELVTEATAFVMSSDFEGFPMVLGEALGRGIPVISTDCQTGPRDIIEHGGNGWLYNVEDHDGLGNILDHIINGRIEVPSQQACIESIRKFAPDKVIGDFEKALQHFQIHLR